MVERWEHMMVRTLGPQLGTMTPDGEVTFSNRSGDNKGVMITLNELGREGWQLVGIVAEQGTYWLKRQLTESVPVAATARRSSPRAPLEQ